MADDRRDLLVLLAGGIVAYMLALAVHHTTMPDILWDYLVLAAVELVVLIDTLASGPWRRWEAAPGRT